MTPVELVLIVVLCGYAVYKQSQRHEVTGGGRRFKLAIIYGGVGLIVGGFYVPETSLEWVFFAASVAASVVVGVVRARFTHVWVDGGHTYSQGTVVSISLFLALVLAKFALGTLAYFLDVSDDGGFGEVLILIGIMVGIQAELVWRRAQAMTAAADAPARGADTHDRTGGAHG
jgi:hypothetical protein